MATKKQQVARPAGKKQAPAGAPKKDKLDPTPREFTWRLGELPSSQHRTGLAGLAMMVRWLGRQPKRKGVCELARLDANVLMLRANQQGLRELFDEVYGAALVERESEERWGEKAKLLRVEKRKAGEGKDRANSKKELTVYIYKVVEPRGAFLADLDGAKAGKRGLWIKLWRDFMWKLVRGRPKTRLPYNARAHGKDATDADEVWSALCEAPERPVKLSGTYFIGTQETSADGVPFRDRERFRFLLHFWPFAVGLTVPMTVDRDGQSQFEGVCVSFPDLIDLESFCALAMEMLPSRSEDALAYRPREAVLDVPAEGGLQFMHALTRRLEEKAGEARTADLLLAVDVVHIEKKGDNTRVRSTARIEPRPGLQSEYVRIKKQFNDPIFRRQRLLNLLAEREWHFGFDRLMATLPASHFLRGLAKEGSFPSQFPFDAYKQFTQEAQ